MNLEQRVAELAAKTNSRLVEHRGRLEVLEAQPATPLVAVGPVPPSSPSVNDLWVDTN